MCSWETRSLGHLLLVGHHLGTSVYVEIHMKQSAPLVCTFFFYCSLDIDIEQDELSLAIYCKS